MSRLTGDAEGNIYVRQEFRDERGSRFRVLKLWPRDEEPIVEWPSDSSVLGKYHHLALSDCAVNAASGVYKLRQLSRARVHKISWTEPSHPSEWSATVKSDWGVAVDVQGLIRVLPWGDPRAAKLVSGEPPSPPPGGRTGEFTAPWVSPWTERAMSTWRNRPRARCGAVGRQWPHLLCPSKASAPAKGV